ncbi:DUF6440 family protein [Clostridium oceanicum]|uniref:DUF6440 family protein n=1 Tax=Clostridium oceanicum TaxID=1543 RepID=A0ABN1JG39_9CLOT
MGKKKRFVEIYSQGSLMGNSYEVIVDAETGVNYLFMNSASTYSGFTVLLDKDGKPVVSDVNNLKND